MLFRNLIIHDNNYKTKKIKQYLTLNYNIYTKARIHVNLMHYSSLKNCNLFADVVVRVRVVFNNLSWCPRGQYPLDCVSRTALVFHYDVNNCLKMRSQTIKAISLLSLRHPSCLGSAVYV